jgi:hypothetical protein
VKIIIAGTRTFNDYELLKTKMDSFLANIKQDIEIVSGGAKGADSLGERYAAEKGYMIHKKLAEWDRYGKSAGYIRNEEMAKYADKCVVFWDGQSKGTKHMIDLAKKYGLDTRVIRY